MRMIYKVLFSSEIPQSYYFRYKLIEGRKASRVTDEFKGKTVIPICGWRIKTLWKRSHLRTCRTLKTSGGREGAQVSQAWHN